MRHAAISILLCTSLSPLAPAADSAAPWKVLFDGTTSAGWRGFRQDSFPVHWRVEDGCLRLLARADRPPNARGDIVTAEQYDNFELELEWRVALGGNSGIKYLINEDGERPVSFEMQVIDNERHRDARDPKRSAGSLYDLIEPTSKTVRPVGEFNQVRIVVRGASVQHWLNGVKIVEFDRSSSAFRELVANSKFRTISSFGQAVRGHVLLQDHGDEVWYRNIRIRPLAP